MSANDIAATGSSNASNSDGRNPTPWHKNPTVLIILCILYCLSPIDLWPDPLPGGFLDDFAVIGYVIKTVIEQKKKKESESNI